MIVEASDAIGRSLAIRRTWEPHVTRLVTQLLSPGDVFVDVGANGGYYALLASRIVGTGGRVYALEPNPDAYELLALNVELNRADNVVALAVAAGATTGRAQLRTPASGDSGMSSLLRVPAEGGEGTSVVVARLVEIVREADARSLRLVKIDVEGFEAEVLRGLEPLLEGGQSPAIIVEVHAGVSPGAPGFMAELCRNFAMHPYLIGEVEARDAAPRLTSIPIAQLPEVPYAFYELLLVPDEWAARTHDLGLSEPMR